jgi:peptidoglycan/LPS O-acetylase OafA/YrhL
MKAGRISQLDALRGLAALTVYNVHALGHMGITMTGGWALGMEHSPLHLFWDGPAAVRLFFVLSGFVLYLAYRHTTGYGWIGFVVSRVRRIYPAFLGALVLAYVVLGCPVGLATLGSQMMLVLPGIDPKLLNPPMWSLMVEMRVSLLFPVIVWMLRDFDGWRIAGLIAVIYCGGAGWAGHNETLIHVPLFVLGALCAKNIEGVAAWWNRVTGLTKWALLCASIVLYQADSITNRWNSLEHPLPAWVNYGIWQAVGLGAVGLIVVCVCSGRIAAILNGPVLQFMGRISYSFYLLHSVVLLVIVRYVQAPMELGGLAVWSIGLLGSVTLATLSYLYVELPCSRHRPAQRAMPVAILATATTNHIITCK